MALFAEIIRTISLWYDDLDIRRLHETSYRNIAIHRLARALEALISGLDLPR